MDSDFAKHVHASDIDWIESLFERFEKQEPIDASWKYFFEGYQVGKVDGGSTADTNEQVVAALQGRKRKVF